MADTLDLGKGKQSAEPAEPRSATTKSQGGTGAGGGFTRSAAPRAKVLGSIPGGVDSRLYGGLDHISGYAGQMSFEVGKDDRMSPKEAGAKLMKILNIFSLTNLMEHEIFTFVGGLWVYHSLNGSSVLGPARSTIDCLGQQFPYVHVATELGNDSRRFHRAFADEIRKQNKRVLDCDPNDVAAMALREQYMQVAYERGLQRAPDLLHDSSDACTGLTAGERALLAGSKRLVLANSYNTADSLQATSRTLGPDNFDSTAGERVGGAEGAVSGRRGG
jgi:hypothetical protein